MNTTKVQPVSGMEDTIQTAATSTSSASSTMSPKVSLFAKKSGFLIPKNKLSGSLVPVFRKSKKPGGADVENEETTKQVIRKTKWGPDLTQDAFVRKGRASAYQTRLDQITQQLKSGIMEAKDDHDSPLAHKSPDHLSIKKSELELERREVIGEILKLNPSYKAPADYKPLLKEDKVTIPIKEHPGRNFIGLIFGPAGDTKKRLEKETGAKIRVYGTKADTRKEIEITSSDDNEAHDDYEELFVIVTAETYEKVDSAVSLIELLITPVLANTKDSSDNPNAISVDQNTASDHRISPVVVTQPIAQFQQIPNQWVPPVQSSGFMTPPPFPNSAPMTSSFGPRTVMSRPLGVSVPSNPHMFQVSNQNMGPPRNPPLQIAAPGQQNFSFTPTGQNQNVRPRPLNSSGWSQPPAATLGPNVTQIMQPSLFRGSQVAPPNNTVRGSWPPSISIRPQPPPQPPINAIRPHQPSSNNFTFQTHQHSQTPTTSQHRPGSQFIHPPQPPSFRPNHGAPPVMHMPHQMGQHVGQRPPPTRVPQFGPGSPGGPFPPRTGNFGQNHPSMGFRPQLPSNQQFRGNFGYGSGRPLGPTQQIYDPFSPTAAAVPRRPGNPQSLRKQENDPEYDDLMASVGVK